MDIRTYHLVRNNEKEENKSNSSLTSMHYIVQGLHLYVTLEVV